MNLAEQALQNLFPDRNEKRRLVVRYSGRFSPYNAHVTYTQSNMEFSLSRSWQDVSEEIQLGLVEHLLCKVYGIKKKSTNQDLYHSFMKNLSKYSVVDEQDDFLLERFHFINEQYFHGLMDAPNLKWGKKAFSKLGHYEYAADTIVISSVFLDAVSDSKVLELLDFVLYHEMLHKKHKYDHKKQRATHHSKAFRIDEQKWHDKLIEKKLKWFLSKKRLKRAFLGF